MKYKQQLQEEFTKVSCDCTIDKFIVDHAHAAFEKIPELAKQLGMSEEDVLERAFELAAEHIEKHRSKK